MKYVNSSLITTFVLLLLLLPERIVFCQFNCGEYLEVISGLIDSEKYIEASQYGYSVIVEEQLDSTSSCFYLLSKIALAEFVLYGQSYEVENINNAADLSIKANNLFYPSSLKDTIIYSDNLWFIASKYMIEGEYIISSKVYSLCSRIREETATPGLVVSGYKQCGIAFALAKNLDSATYYFNKMITYDKELNADPTFYTFEALYQLSNLGFIGQESEISIGYASQLLNYGVNNFPENSEIVATCYQRLGDAQSYGDILSKDALSSYKRALSVFESIDNVSVPFSTLYLNIGTSYYFLEQYDSSRIYLQKYLSDSTNIAIDQSSNKARALELLGGIHLISREFELAEGLFFQALNIYKSQGNLKEDIRNIYYRLGGLYNASEDYSEAINYYEKNLELQVEIFGKASIESARASETLSRAYDTNSQKDKGTQYLNEAYIIYSKLKNNYIEDYFAFLNSMIIHYTSIDKSKTEEIIEESLRIKREENSLSDYNLALAYNAYALFHSYYRNLATAIEFREKANKHFTLINDINSIIDNNLNNARDFLELGEFGKSLEITDSIYKEHYKILDSQRLASLYEKKAYTYSKLSNIDSSKYYYLKAIEILETAGFLFNASLTLANFGLFCFNYALYEESIEALLKSLKIQESLYGSQSPQIIRILSNLAFVYSDIKNPQRDVEKSLIYNTRSIEIAKKSGRLDDIVDAYLWNSENYFDKGNFGKAKEYLDHSINTLSKLNQSDFTTGFAFERVALHCLHQKRFIEALKILEDQYDFYNRFPEVKHYHFGKIEQYKGLVYYALQHFDEAKRSFELSLESFIHDSTLYADDIASIYEMLGHIYLMTSEYQLASLYFTKSKRIYEVIYQYDKSGLAQLYFNIGSLYYQNNELKLAEDNLLTALNFIERENSYDAVNYRSNISILLARIYNLEQRIPEALSVLYESSSSIDLLSIEYKVMAEKLKINNYLALAASFDNNNEFSKCLDYLDSISTIPISIYNTSPFESLDYLSQYAEIYQSIGEYDSAISIYIDELKILDDFSGIKKSVFYGDIYSGLGYNYFMLKQYKNAGNFLEKAKDNHLENLGDWHVSLADDYIQLAEFYYITNEYNTAVSSVLSALEIYLDYFEREIIYFSEWDRLRYLNNIHNSIEIAFSIFFNCSEYITITQDDYKSLLNSRMRHKFLINKKYNNLSSLLTDSEDPERLIYNRQLREKKQQLNFLYENQNIDFSTFQEESQLLVKEINHLENEVINTLQESVKIYPSVEQLQNSIGDQSAAIEIFRIRDYSGNLQSVDSSFNYSGLSDRIGYAFLVLSGNEEKEIQVCYKKNQSVLENHYYDHYIDAISLKSRDTLSYCRYWSFIDSLAGNLYRYYISNDGIYHMINLNTLLNDEGRYIIEDKSIHYTNSFDMVLDNESKVDKKQEIALLGNPTYSIMASTESDNRMVSQSILYNAIDIRRDVNESFYIPNLPGTLDEIKAIASMFTQLNWNINFLSGINANEDTLKKLSNPGVLHIATHGYFNSEVRLLDNFSDEYSKSNLNRYIDPLFISGLLLTGAQNTFNKVPFKSENNGILTSFEAGLLNLANTNLVILSACETGLGQVLNGSGVFGLQSGFFQAGAKNVLMSLWNVDDNATKKLMIDFYSGYIQNISINEALRNSQLKLLKQDKYRHPFFWGAFITVQN